MLSASAITTTRAPSAGGPARLGATGRSRRRRSSQTMLSRFPRSSGRSPVGSARPSTLAGRSAGSRVGSVAGSRRGPGAAPGAVKPSSSASTRSRCHAPAPRGARAVVGGGDPSRASGTGSSAWRVSAAGRLPDRSRYCSLQRSISVCTTRPTAAGRSTSASDSTPEARSAWTCRSASVSATVNSTGRSAASASSRHAGGSPAAAGGASRSASRPPRSASSSVRSAYSSRSAVPRRLDSRSCAAARRFSACCNASCRRLTWTRNNVNWARRREVASARGPTSSSRAGSCPPGVPRPSSPPVIDGLPLSCLLSIASRHHCGPAASQGEDGVRDGKKWRTRSFVCMMATLARNRRRLQ